MNKIFIFIVGLVIASCTQPKKEKASLETGGITELPPLMLTMLTGEKVMVSSLPGNTIIVFFNPDCDHCQREAQAIQSQMEAFKKYTLYFVAPGLPADIQLFADTYHLTGYSNVFFAKAEIPDVIRILGPMSTPSLFIYSNEKKLVKKFDGETKIEEILKFL